MKTKLVKVDGYWIVVSDSIGSKWIYYESIDGWMLEKLNKKSKDSISTQWYLQASQNLLHNLPTITFSDEISKELGIINIEKISDNDCTKDVFKSLSDQLTINIKYCYARLKNIWQNAYNQCLLDNADKKFTLEDMRKLYEGTLQNVGTSIKQSDMPTWKQVKQSLTKEEYFCKLEKDDTWIDDGGKMAFDLPFQPKITNNSVIIIKIWK